MPLGDEEPASPGPLTAEEITEYVVTAAVWAPSVHNTQPWRFTAEDQRISLRADAARQLRVADPDGREMMISCGAALFTARLALRSLDLLPEVIVLPDPGQPLLVARVSWGRRAVRTEFEQRLFGLVRQRRTHRGGFDTAPLPPGFLAALREGAARYGAVLRIVADDGRRAALAAAVQEAEQAQRLDAERVAELARWAPPPGSGRADGVPPDSYPARAEHTDPDFPGRDFAHGHGWGLPPPSTAPWPRSAGVAAVLTTAHDRPVDWVNAGQALQRILLTATASGVAAALHTQPLEFARLRESIRTGLSEGAYPQLVLRFGTVIQAAASVRRLPDDVLSTGSSEDSDTREG
ncbi:MAG TPA: nitroreductase family protein [Streptosporangiaceae bacterium]|nr:nitroreductase family protein [Streptosporangiaceae bacterium]